MGAMKEKFLKLDKSKKIQFVAASILTLFLTVGVSAYAWFALSGSLETLTKVKEPENMDIRAGGGTGKASPDPVVNFDLSDIDIENIAKGTPELRVFTVSPGDYKKMEYKLQLAYTTNIPFTYKVYTAINGTNQDYDVTYQHLNGKDDVYYYKKGVEIPLTPKNLEENSVSYYGREIADMDKDNFYFKNTYTVGTDNPELYAVPVYAQSGKITQGSNENGYDYYILEIDWNQEEATTRFSEWNEAVNKKETDMIYITASRSS